jgi:hypothetical protein
MVESNPPLMATRTLDPGLFINMRQIYGHFLSLPLAKTLKFGTFMSQISAKEVALIKRLKVLEQEFKDSGFGIRYEKGNFQSGYCLFEQQGVVIVNKFFSLSAKIETLEEIKRNIASKGILGEAQGDSTLLVEEMNR